MDLAELKMAVKAGSIDTVLIGLTDMQGRLMGKRMHARHFVDDVVEHGAEACNYLLAVDVEMNTVEGYAMSSWDQGYGDFVLKPDLDTLTPVPWQEATALVLCDLQWHDGKPIVASPRQILRAQLDRLAKLGWTAQAGTELEFLVFDDSYEEAWDRKYTDLTPSNRYNVDYSMLGTARVEPLLRRIRNSMMEAGMLVEDSKGECNFGQHEINFRYSDALRMADDHVVYKNGAKEIAAQEGMAISFMAKYDEREGSSCHIHLSITDDKGKNVFEGDKAIFDQFIAGLLATLRELTLFLAPNINSYKRFAAGSFAPTTVAWGERQPNVRDPHGRPWAGQAARMPRAGRRREPVPRARRPDRGWAPRRREQIEARADARRQRLHRAGQAAATADAARGARPVRRLPKVATAAFGEGSSITTSTTRGSSSTRSTRR